MAVFKCAGAKRFHEDGESYCDYEAPKPWAGRCPKCLRLFDCDKVGVDKRIGSHLATAAQAADTKVKYIPTDIDHVDYVLGGGLVKGSMIVFGGEQGAGKSSLAALVCDGIQKRTKRTVLYASGEQHSHGVMQIFERAGVANPEIKIMGSDNNARNVHSVIELCEGMRPFLVVFDSLHHMSSHGGVITGAMENLESARIIHEHCEKRGLCAIAISHLNASLEYKGGTDVPYLVETEMLLHRFIPGIEQGTDGDPYKLFGPPEEEGQDEVSVLRSRLRRRKEEIETQINLAQVRTLLVRKNRNGREGRKAFFTMTGTGQLEPIRYNLPKEY